MSKFLNIIASVLALMIGAMAVFAGGKVLLAILPDSYVINGLPIYNSIIGVVSLFLSIVFWTSDRFSGIVERVAALLSIQPRKVQIQRAISVP